MILQHLSYLSYKGIKQQKVKWILKIRETNTLTQTCTKNLLGDITDICTNIVEDLKTDIIHKLTSSPITLPSTTFKEISETFDNEIYRQPLASKHNTSSYSFTKNTSILW